MIWKRIHALIRHVASGHEVRHETVGAWDAEGFDATSWTDGANVCDCTRRGMFERARGMPNTEIEWRCGRGEFVVRIVDAETGVVLYEDDAWCT